MDLTADEINALRGSLDGFVDRLLAKEGVKGIVRILESTDPEYAFKFSAYPSHFHTQIFNAIRSLVRIDSTAAAEARQLVALLLVTDPAVVRSVFPAGSPELLLSEARLNERFGDISECIGFF